MGIFRIFLLVIVSALLMSTVQADVISEDFDSGTFPPTGWTLIDNTPDPNGWQLNSYFAMLNYTGGTGECASLNSDFYGWGLIDAELITPTFVVPDSSTLEFDHSFRWYSGGLYEQADVDISISGGAWINLANYSGGDDGYPVGVHKSIDLSSHAGQQAQIRFRYYDANWDWWWQIDNVRVTGSAPFQLSVDNLVAGQQATFTVTGGIPSQDTYLAYSITGTGSTFIPPLNVTLGIASPRKGAGPTMSDPSGNVVWTLPIPSASGQNVWFQACQNGQATNVVAETIQ